MPVTALTTKEEEDYNDGKGARSKGRIEERGHLLHSILLKLKALGKSTTRNNHKLVKKNFMQIDITVLNWTRQRTYSSTVSRGNNNVRGYCQYKASIFDISPFNTRSVS